MTFRCPGRHPTETAVDHWRQAPNGDSTCSYCGSMSEENFVDILGHYVAGEEGYHFDPSTKKYKAYANRPGVANASQGAIKFYLRHVDKDHPDLAKREAIFAQAMERYRADMQRRFGLAPVEVKAAPIAEGSPV